MVLAVLKVLAAQLFSSRPSNRAHRGVTIVACLAIASVVGTTGFALTHPNPNAFGPHNFADYVPVIILFAGAGIWLVETVRAKLANTHLGPQRQ